MAEVVSDTVLVKNTCVIDGEDYSETARLPATLWRKVGGKKSIEEGERGLAKWLRLRNPRFGPDLRVTFLRDEETKASEVRVRPSDL